MNEINRTSTAKTDKKVSMKNLIAFHSTSKGNAKVDPVKIHRKMKYKIKKTTITKQDPSIYCVEKPVS